jgi:siroheme synthase-like protein
VVVGGGLIAQRKVTTLLGCGARVTVVSPALTARLRSLARQGRIRHAARRFKAPDVGGAWLAFAATDDQAINVAVFRSASRERIFTNVVDQQPLCSFIAPAIARRGEVVIAVSTGGGSPALAKRVRRDVEELIGEDYAQMLRLLRSLRAAAKRRLPTYQDRKRYFDGLVGGRVFELVNSGRLPAARREALRTLVKCQALVVRGKSPLSARHLLSLRNGR